MDRRKALRNIGTGIGAIAVTPTVVSLFQSCQTTPSYATAFFSQEQFAAVSSLMELIIPATDIPGAIELKLPEFTYAYINAVWNAQQKESFASSWDAFNQLLLPLQKKMMPVHSIVRTGMPNWQNI